MEETESKDTQKWASSVSSARAQLLLVGNKCYLFGGLANDSEDPKNNIPEIEALSCSCGIP